MHQRHSTIFQGIKTESKVALLYYVTFCLRRFDLVLVNFYFSPSFPLSDWASHAYLLKVIVFLIMQTMYIVYIIDSKPHTDNIFIKLEYFNEGLLVLLCYMMFIYTGIVPCKVEESGYNYYCNSKAIFTDKIPLYISLGIIAIIVVGNFAILIRNSFLKIKLMILKKKKQSQIK